jgi:uncharacterized protein
MFHAVSPAVARASTDRAVSCAQEFDWNIKLVDAGEFEDPEYLANPLNRCFFCKSALYGTIVKSTSACVLSGTNADDLSDFRPGLDAARNYYVRHPFVEAEIGKKEIRNLASIYGLSRFAELPASPCLSSRVETGIPIDSSDLRSIEAIEGLINARFSCKTVRCRIRVDRIDIEIDDASLPEVRKNQETLKDEINSLISARLATMPINFMPYKMGSAFLQGVV